MASGPITSQQIEGEKVEAVTDFLFLVFKIMADDGCSQEIRGPLLLDMKAMTYLDSVLKTEALVPMCQQRSTQSRLLSPQWSHTGCENWTVKKAERQRADAMSRDLGDLKAPRWLLGKESASCSKKGKCKWPEKRDGTLRTGEVRHRHWLEWGEGSVIT